MENTDLQERLFIAIDFPQDFIAELVAIQQQLQKLKLFEGKFIASEQIHLTLQFIGSVDEDFKQIIQNALRLIRYQSFEVCLGKLGILPNERYIRIIWVDCVAEALQELVRHIETALKSFMVLEDRKFLSHITLARVKQVHNKKKLMQALSNIQVPHVCCMVTDFVLKKSILTNKGPIYYNIEHYSLTKI